MKLNDAKNICIGATPAKAVYLGKELIWPDKDPPLPDGYTRLLAIESTSSPGISVLPFFSLSSSSKVVIDYAHPDAFPNQTVYIYSSVRTNKLQMRIVARTGSTVLQSGFAVNSENGTALWTYGAPVESGVRYTITAQGNTCTFVPADAGKSTITLTTSDSLYIPEGAGGISYINAYNNANGWQKGSRYYSAQHYKDGALTVDYVPALFLPDDDPASPAIIGMYDRITGHFCNFGAPGQYWKPVYADAEEV